MSTSKSRYCMVVHAYYPIREPRVEREAEALAKNNYSVDVLCLRHSFEPAFERIENVNIYRLPLKRYKKMGVIVQFFEYLYFFILTFLHLAHPSARYDVVHVHNPPDFLIFGALISRLRGAKLVLDIHDLMPEFYLSRFNNGFMSDWFSKLLKLQEKFSCCFAHHVITVSEPWRQTLIKRGTPADKISVVMNVAGEKFRAGAIKVKKPATNRRFHILYHGTLTERYGLDLALQAIAKVRHKIPELQFTIHGDGVYLDKLRNLADDLNLNDVVNYSTEFVPTEDLPNLIASAQVGLIPYRKDIFTDGILPTKLMEYVALGVPVIVARTSTIETYFDNSMVEFFTPENVDEMAASIYYLYQNRHKLPEMAKRADVFNQQYNWAKQAQNLIELANELTYKKQEPAKLA